MCLPGVKTGKIDKRNNGRGYSHEPGLAGIGRANYAARHCAKGATKSGRIGSFARFAQTPNRACHGAYVLCERKAFP
jgi:hypothetical protein